VLIAAFISAKGAPRAIVRTWIEGAFELLVSPKLLAELARVLARPKFRRYASESEARAYVAFLKRFATLGPDVESPARLSPDPGDDYLLALARSHFANFLVSGDADLCQLENTEPPVLTPRAFLNRLT
jgi:putative PIN family toxin of toxin-antitoxin system